ncbi:MAG: murein biosynthesis integral membrane protein MurJ [Thermodesulfobacteriota bacterium]
MTANTRESQDLSATDRSEHVSEVKAMTRAAGVVGLWTSLSRVLGYVRDMVIALFLGASLGADAFFVAFRIPNLLRRLFAEGALSAAFIPTYVETLQKEGLSNARRLAQTCFTVASIVLAAVTLLGIAFTPWIVGKIAPGFVEDAGKFLLTVNLTRIMFPYIFFVSLVALAAGVLNSKGHFAAPAAAPVLLNLCMIFSVSVFAAKVGIEPYYALAIGVTVGGVAQLWLQLPFMKRVGVPFRLGSDFRNPALKRIGKLFVPAAFSGAVYQVNVLVGTILASLLVSGSVSWLYYADRVVELPLGIFAIAAGTAVLPSMSRQAGNGDMAGLQKSISYALRLIGFFTIPASVGLIILREPIVACLFQRGLFTAMDTERTASALLWYTVGLWAFSALKVVNQAFYSLKDTKTPLWVSMGAVATNLAAGLLLMGPMAHGGLALATSIAAAFNVIVLFVILVKRLGGFPGHELATAASRFLLASVPMAVMLLYVQGFADWKLGFTLWNGLILAALVLGGLLIFLAGAHLLRAPEVRFLFGLLRNAGRSDTDLSLHK